LDKFDAERKISFIPPDGEAEVMKYRTTEGISLPFRLHHNIQETGDRIDIHLTVKSTFSTETFAMGFKVRVPVPKNTAVCHVNVGTGRAKYLPESSCILWKVWRFAGNSESTLASQIELIHTTNRSAWSRPPISMDFEVPMYTSSGLQIRFMKIVEKSGYHAVKWVRYLTRAGNYQYRI
jgi:AP-2 complex subunit mu-1